MNKRIILITLFVLIFFSCTKSLSTDTYVQCFEHRYGKEYTISVSEFNPDPITNKKQKYLFTKLDYGNGVIILISNLDKSDCNIYQNTMTRTKD